MSTSRCGLASAKLTTSAAGSGQSWRQKRNNNLAHEARQGAEMALAANPLRQERGQTGGWTPFDHNARPNLRFDPFLDPFLAPNPPPLSSGGGLLWPKGPRPSTDVP